MRLKDKILAKRIAEGDEEAFNKLYYKYKNLIYYHVASSCKNKSDIDDMVQEIFLKILENIKLYKSEFSSLATWITIISRNHMIDYAKKKDYIIYDNDYIDNVISPESESDFDIDDYTSELTQREKDILVYKIIYRLSHKEISKILGITIDVSKKTYKRATSKAYEEWLENESQI